MSFFSYPPQFDDKSSRDYFSRRKSDTSEPCEANVATLLCRVTPRTTYVATGSRYGSGLFHHHEKLRRYLHGSRGIEPRLKVTRKVETPAGHTVEKYLPTRVATRNARVGTEPEPRENSEVADWRSRGASLNDETTLTSRRLLTLREATDEGKSGWSW